MFQATGLQTWASFLVPSACLVTDHRAAVFCLRGSDPSSLEGPLRHIQGTDVRSADRLDSRAAEIVVDTQLKRSRLSGAAKPTTTLQSTIRCRELRSNQPRTGLAFPAATCSLGFTMRSPAVRHSIHAVTTSKITEGLRSENARSLPHPETSRFD